MSTTRPCRNTTTGRSGASAPVAAGSRWTWKRREFAGTTAARRDPGQGGPGDPADVGDEFADGHGQDGVHVLLREKAHQVHVGAVAVVEQLGERDELHALQGEVLVERRLHRDLLREEVLVADDLHEHAGDLGEDVSCHDGSP